MPRLFAAGLIPGPYADRALHGGRASLVANIRKDYAPAGAGVPMRERLAAMKEPWQFVVLFLVTIGGIYAGIFSPTEAASIGAFGAIVLGIARRAG